MCNCRTWAYFVTTLYAIHTPVHAYAICWDHVSSCPVLVIWVRPPDSKQPGQCPGMPGPVGACVYTISSQSTGNYNKSLYTLTWCRLIPINSWKAWKDPGNETKLDTQDSEFNATSKALVDMVLIEITLAKFPFWWVIAQEQVYTTEYTRKSGEDYVKTIVV